MTKAKPKRREKAPVEQAREVVGASLTPADLVRLDAFGERMRASSGLEAKRGTLALMLIRKGLDTVEATS